MDNRLDEQERSTQDKKNNYIHVVRAKLYGILAINTLEGISREIDSLLPYDMEKDNVDALSDQFRKFRNGQLYPTSYGDHMDRAIKSLGKDLGIAVTVDLTNTQAIKKELTRLVRLTPEDEREKVAEWLRLPNDKIMKSSQFDQLINRCCHTFYKMESNQIKEDNLSFIKRAANELLRNKASKEAMRKRLTSHEYAYNEDAEDVDANQDMYDIQSGVTDTQMMMVDSSVMTPAGKVAINSIGEMSGIQQMPSVNSMIGIPSMGTIPISNFEGMQPIQHINQLHPVNAAPLMTARDVDHPGNTNVSIPIPMSNLNGMNPIGLTAISPMNVNNINSLQISVGMNAIQPMNINVMDNQRN